MQDMEKLFPIISTRRGFCSGVVSHPAENTVTNDTIAMHIKFKVFFIISFSPFLSLIISQITLNTRIKAKTPSQEEVFAFIYPQK